MGLSNEQTFFSPLLPKVAASSPAEIKWASVASSSSPFPVPNFTLGEEGGGREGLLSLSL